MHKSLMAAFLASALMPAAAHAETKTAPCTFEGPANVEATNVTLNFNTETRRTKIRGLLLLPGPVYSGLQEVPLAQNQGDTYFTAVGPAGTPRGEASASFFTSLNLSIDLPENKHSVRVVLGDYGTHLNCPVPQ